ncbi:trans-resveratrol di-O-methyltransferase [Gossypium raimondii]|nr:trans-resveratrol di-O-methyltransferase [Gossypium raimondii]
MNMGNANGEHAIEALQAQAHIWRHAFNFVSFMSLKCALDLGILDIIHDHGKPMTITELVSALQMLNPAKACDIYRLMRILVHSDFFARQKLDNDAQEEGYVLTNSSRILLKNNPFCITPTLKATMDPIITKPWSFLGTWFQNDDHTPFATAYGKTLWDYFTHDPQLKDLINDGLPSDSQLVTSVLVDNCKGAFEGLDSLVDVGGGTGTTAKAIADTFPLMECTVFDLPNIVAGLQGSKNLKYVGGNMFEAFPVADAILLKKVLHDWNDEGCLTILKRCKEAISSQDKVGRKLIIIDMVVRENEQVNDEASSLTKTQLFFDMFMLVLVAGKERREEEWAKLFLEAGFSYYKITTIVGLTSLIEVYP